MGTDSKVRRNCLGDHIRTFWRHPRIDRATKIAPWPAVEGAVLHRRNVVGHEVRAEFVAFIYRSPERAGRWLPAHAVGVAKPGGENALLAGGEVDFPDRSAPFLHLDPILADIRIGAYGGV